MNPFDNNCVFRLFFPLLIVFLNCRSIFAEANALDAREILETRVEADGFVLGYDEDTDQLVRVGVSTCQMPPPWTMDSTIFFTTRDILFRKALVDAKFKTMQSVMSSINASVLSRFESNEEESVSTDVSSQFVHSHLVLHGFRILNTAESWHDGLYEVAVAIGWSPFWEEETREVLAQGWIKDDDIPCDEWEKWVVKQDLSRIMGACSFKDSNGMVRFVGIGSVDVEGKSGPGLNAARSLARVKAVQMLSYQLVSNLDGRQVLKLSRMLEEQSDGIVVADTIESLANRFEQVSRYKNCNDSEVYTTTIIHPLTGRKMFVSVVGIEPRDLAEMNLLENITSAADSNDDGNARSAHEERPEPSRPNHGDRAVISRPDHGEKSQSSRPDHVFQQNSNHLDHGKKFMFNHPKHSDGVLFSDPPLGMEVFYREDKRRLIN